MREEGDEERFIHRLEAFSDIVIGFSLAQLGATLIVPGHAAELVSNPSWIFSFAWTFALVCLMWWSHNSIFRSAFAATRWTIPLNFVLLATIVLLVFFAQVFSRATVLHDAIVAGRLYFATLAANYIVTAVLVAAGMPRLRGSIESVRYDRGRRLGIINGVSGLCVGVGVCVSFAYGDDAWIFPALGLVVMAGFTLGRVIARRIVAPAAKA